MKWLVFSFRKGKVKVNSSQWGAGSFCKKEEEGSRRDIKKYKPTSHRFNRLPLLPSGPGGVQQELVVPACVAKVRIKTQLTIGGFSQRCPLSIVLC
jgi:hypothetical protein